MKALRAALLEGRVEAIQISTAPAEPDPDHMIMADVREHGEGLDVELAHDTEAGGRLVIRAYNEAGHASTAVDLLDLIAWLKANRPDLLA